MKHTPQYSGDDEAEIFSNDKKNPIMMQCIETYSHTVISHFQNAYHHHNNIHNNFFLKKIS